MTSYSINTDVERMSQLVRLAAFKFAKHEDVTHNLHAEVEDLGGKSPVKLAAESSDGFVKALQYLNRMSI